MKSSGIPTLPFCIGACLAASFSGKCEQPKPPVPVQASKPSVRLLFDGLGWKQDDNPRYSFEIGSESSLAHPESEPNGISIINFSDRLLRNWIGFPRPVAPIGCYYEGLIWALFDQFGYSARVVLGPDRSLVGFAFRVWNNSKSYPLTLMRHAGGPLFYTDINIDGQIVPERIPNLRRPALEDMDPEEWTLKPREKAEVFVPLRDLLPEGFEPKDGKTCTFNVQVIVVPKGTKRLGHSPFPYPVFPYTLMITKAGIALDPKNALKEAEEHAAAILKQK